MRGGKSVSQKTQRCVNSLAFAFYRLTVIPAPSHRAAKKFQRVLQEGKHSSHCVHTGTECPITMGLIPRIPARGLWATNSSIKGDEASYNSTEKKSLDNGHAISFVIAYIIHVIRCWSCFVSPHTHCCNQARAESDVPVYQIFILIILIRIGCLSLEGKKTTITLTFFLFCFYNLSTELQGATHAQWYWVEYVVFQRVVRMFAWCNRRE